MRSRLEAELAASGERHPRLRAAFGFVLRHRLWVIAGLALVVAVLDGGGHFEVQDPQLFIHAGRRLFGGDALNVFADKAVQEGPLALLFWGLVGFISDLINVNARMVASIVIYVGFTLALVLLIRRAFEERERPSADIELFAAAIVLLGGFTWTMLSTGHIAEGVIPLLWFQAARDARRGRVERAGLLIALSAGLKLWGVLGVPLLLLDPDLSVGKLVRGALVAGGGAALLYAPFALFGTFNTFDYRWQVAGSSFVHRLFPGDPTFSWEQRVAQSAIVVLVGSGLAWMARGSRRALWAVPLALIGAKLVLDPILFEYYSLSLGVAALLAGVLVARRWPQWVRVPGAALVYLVLDPSWLLDGNELALPGLVIATAACLEIYRRRRVGPPVEASTG